MGPDQLKSSVADLRPWLDPGATPFVAISGLSKKFSDREAIDNVSLDIFQGELFCLLGASGSGKTTLLRLLAGFESADTGQITIDGKDMAAVPANIRPVNMMFQSYALFPHMDVFNNIAYGLKRLAVPGAKLRSRVEELLTLVRLEGFEKRRPDQLSGGQRQRVALARALARQPKLLLLDEPLGALDKKLRTQTQFELIKIQEQLGVTFIVVTHDAEEAMALATRIGVMKDGKIVQVGTPREIYQHPVSTYVAEIVGTTNIFQATCTSSVAGQSILNAPDFGGEIKVASTETFSPRQPLWFAIRPEHISLSRKKPDEKFNCTEGIVDDVLYLGDSSVLQVTLNSGRQITVTRPNSHATTKDQQISWDEPVFVTWPTDAGSLLTS